MAVRTLVFLLAGALAPALAQNRSGGAADNPHNHTEPEARTTPAGSNGDLQMSLASGAGGVLAGLLGSWALAGKGGEPAKLVSDRGPQFPALFSMSAFSVEGFVKGGWPMALDYELREPGIYMLTVTAEGVAPFTYLLDGTRTGRQTAILTLPARFGSEGVVAVCTVRALSNSPGEARQLFFRVFGWACGGRAVGSIAIDQLSFTPSVVRPKNKEEVFYGFHSHADFEKVTAEFERVGLVKGNIVAQVEDKQNVDEVVRRNTRISHQRWNPKKAAAGQHLLQIRAWYSLNHGGDWVIAWSPQIVRIEP
jgi:hypothetical protein